MQGKHSIMVPSSKRTELAMNNNDGISEWALALERWRKGPG